MRISKICDLIDPRKDMMAKMNICQSYLRRAQAVWRLGKI